MMFGCAPKMGDTSVHCCNFSAKHVHLHLENDDINHEILRCPIFTQTSKKNTIQGLTNLLTRNIKFVINVLPLAA